MMNTTPLSSPKTDRLPFYTFLTANVISLVGNNLTMLAVPWFVLETTGSAAKTGLVGFFTALPAILAAFLGGAVVDRLGYKRMSIAADLASGVTVALIPLLYHTVGLQFWQLLLLVFFSALLDAPGNTARQSLLPDVAQAGRVRLEQANAAQQTVQRGATLIGPAVAGVLIVWLGSSNVLWLDAASFVVSAGLFAWAVPGKPMQAGQPNVPAKYWTQLRDGLHFVRRDRLILALVITVAVTNFLDTPLFAVVMPVYARQVFGEATQLGLMISSFGAGAMLGALLFGWLGPRLPRRFTFIIAFMLVGLPFWLLALMPPFPVVVAALIFTGVAAGPINPLLMTVFQERIPAEMRGRVFGMVTAAALVAAPLGMVLTGYLVEALGVTQTIWMIAGGYLLVTAAQFFNPALHQMDQPAA